MTKFRLYPIKPSDTGGFARTPPKIKGPAGTSTEALVIDSKHETDECEPKAAATGSDLDTSTLSEHEDSAENMEGQDTGGESKKKDAKPR